MLAWPEGRRHDAVDRRDHAVGDRQRANLIVAGNAGKLAVALLEDETVEAFFGALDAHIQHPSGGLVLAARRLRIDQHEALVLAGEGIQILSSRQIHDRFADHAGRNIVARGRRIDCVEQAILPFVRAFLRAPE